MAMNRSLTLGVLGMTVIAAVAGCGAQSLPTGAMGRQAAPFAGVLSVQGVDRKLGFDFDRYERVLSKKSKAVHMPRQGMLPSAVDNRKFCSPVADQGKLGACTAFSLGKGMREFMENKNGEQFVPVSALGLYYDEREAMGSDPWSGKPYTEIDSGSTVTEGMGVLKDIGVAPEALWPYDILKFAVKPSEQAYSAAGKLRIRNAVQLAGLDDVKAALAKGQAVPFGFKVFESFRKVGADGMMPMPAPSEKALGGHAVLAVGYDDAKKVLIVRNSWAEKWGDKGYFYMPYENVSKYSRDFWTSDI